MVRNYRKKTSRTEINESNMKKAILDVRNGVETQTTAAEKYGINRTTLIMRMKREDPLKPTVDSTNSHSEDEFCYQSKYSSRQIFTKQREEELVAYIKKCCFYAYGLSYQTFRKFVYEYAKTNQIATPVGWDGLKEASKDWLYAFLKRNPTISLRKPEKVSLARLRGFTKSAVEEFYSNLRTVYEKYSFQPKDVYNLDETGVTTVLEPPKVLAQKGQRIVSQATSAERGSLVTMVGIISASGNHLPPVYVFPRLRFNERFTNGCFPGTLALNSKSGWMTSELFIDVVKHIQRNTNCSKDKPILVLLDNHSSHCSLESITFCNDKGIVMLSFPPHTSHRLQPLDVSIFGPFKQFCRSSFNDFTSLNSGKQITIYDVARLTNQPFQKSFSPQNILNGFRSTGIYPFNSQTFSDDEFTLESSLEEESLPVANENESIENIQNVMDMQVSPQINTLQNRTPEMIRPVKRLRASKKTTKSVTSRIITSSAEKRKVVESIEKQRSKNVKRTIVFSSKDGRAPLKKKSTKTQITDPETTEESEDNISYSDSINSIGSIPGDEASYEVEDTDLSKWKLTDEDTLNIGDYVLVKFAYKNQKPFYYIGEITEIFSNNAFNINYLRRSSTLNWVFIRPDIEDNSLTTRSEIELKLPNPTNPAGTSRCRTKYLFDVNFGDYYIK